MLDAAGRTPAQIWLLGGSFYKFVLKTSTYVQLGSYDNIPAIDDITTTTNILTVTGTDTLTASATPALNAYAVGQLFSFVTQNTNLGPVTINIDSLGPRNVTRDGLVSLAAGDLLAGKLQVIEYTGAVFQLFNGFSFQSVRVTGTGYSPNIALTDAATVAWDTDLGQTATFTFVSSNRTIGAPTNLRNGAFYALAVVQNAGSNTLTWNAIFKWAAGTVPTLSTGAGAKDLFVFRYDGTALLEQGRSQGIA